MKYVGVGLAGTAGALTRYGFGLLIGGTAPSSFPWAILIINVTGSFILGFLVGFGLDRGLIPVAWRAPLSVGFVGSYTTFSTWTVDTVLLLDSGHWAFATANVLLSLVAGLLAVWLGWAVSRLPARTPFERNDER